MSGIANSALARGLTQATGRLAHLLGTTYKFPNFRSLTAQAPNDGRDVYMKLVKNGEASTAILPGSLCAWKTALHGNTVVLPAATAGVQICGIADFLMPAAGAAAAYDFWMIVLGPCRFLLDANAGCTEGDCLINSASVAGCIRTGTTSGAIVGRSEATALAGGGAIGTATTMYGFFGAAGQVSL